MATEKHFDTFRLTALQQRWVPSHVGDCYFYMQSLAAIQCHHFAGLARRPHGRFGGHQMSSIKSLFSRLSRSPSQLSGDDMKVLERFVVLLYKRTSSLQKVNEERKRLFAFGNRQLENIPPTSAALLQHAKHAAFQAGHMWGQSLVANASTPSPEDWGWERDGDTWSPTWSSLAEASKSCRELVKCACKSNCTGRCKCYKANLPCTELCACGGQCVRVV